MLCYQIFLSNRHAYNTSTQPIGTCFDRVGLGSTWGAMAPRQKKKRFADPCRELTIFQDSKGLNLVLFNMNLWELWPEPCWFFTPLEDTHQFGLPPEQFILSLLSCGTGQKKVGQQQKTIFIRIS